MRIFAVAAITMVSAAPALAATSHLGAFRPVAAEEGGRAIWVNPAAIGKPARATSVTEFVWNQIDSDGESVEPEGLRFFNFSAGTDRSSFGFQWEYDDIEGLADWTLSWGKPIPWKNGISLGTSLEWRAGKDGNFDLMIGSLLPLGESLRAALVVRDLREAEVDGVSTERLWQGGVSWRSERLFGRVTYDLVYPQGRGSDAEHWFGVGMDRGNRLRLSYALSDTGDWSGTADLVRKDFLIGAGVLDRGGGSRRIFASIDYAPAPPRPVRSFESISR